MQRENYTNVFEYRWVVGQKDPRGFMSCRQARELPWKLGCRDLAVP
jgi:hypothetical protein